MSLTHDDVRRIAIEAMPEDHAEDHRWTRNQRDTELELKKLKHKIFVSACIWAVPLVLGFIVTSLWHEFLSKLSAFMK